MSINTKSIPWPIILAGIAVVAAIVMYSKSSGAVNVGTQVIPATSTASTDAANAQIAASNAASAQSYDQIIAQEFGQMVGFGTTIQNNIATTNLADIQAKRDEKIASLQAQTQQTQYNDQLAAAQAQANSQASQANSNMWGGIVSGALAIFGL